MAWRDTSAARASSIGHQRPRKEPKSPPPVPLPVDPPGVHPELLSRPGGLHGDGGRRGGPARESPSGGEDPDPDPDLAAAAAAAAAAGKRCCVRGDQVAMVRGSLSAVVRCPPAEQAGPRWRMAASEEAHEAAEGGLDLALSLAWQGRAHCSLLSAGGVSLSLSLWKGSFALSASWASFPAAFSSSALLSFHPREASLTAQAQTRTTLQAANTEQWGRKRH